MDKTLEKQLPALYEQDGKENQIAYAKYYTEFSHWVWYALEYSPIQKLFYGLVDGDEKEFGYFTLDELESLKYSIGDEVVRDYDFKPTPIKELS